MSGEPIPAGTKLTADREAAQPAAAPTLPSQWRAPVLLTPFGDMQPPMERYDQLVVADVAYNDSERWMRVSLYLIEDQQYFDFLFEDGQWYWLISTPGGPVVGYYGPFTAPLTVPATNFIAAGGGRFGNLYEIMGNPCQNWVIPTDDIHGTWYSFSTVNGALTRIFTFDNDNPVGIPILGSSYLANFADFVVGPVNDAAHAYVHSHEATPAPPGYENEMLTQEDVQRALAEPLASAPCTLQQIQALIPGLVPTPVGVTLPEWTDQTFIRGWTIGDDFIPYYTLVYYWYSRGNQQTRFIGLGLTPGQGDYSDMQSTCLYSFHDDPSKDYTDMPQYEFTGGQWQPQCCDGKIPGVGVPRPDFVSATGGQVAAMIVANPAFGLNEGQALNLIRCPFQRGPGEEALFWVWFTADQTGVLFTEANFVRSTDHSLQLIDYSYFERDATWITPDDFTDPCPSLKPCPTTPAAQAPPTGRRRVIGPRQESATATRTTPAASVGGY